MISIDIDFSKDLKALERELTDAERKLVKPSVTSTLNRLALRARTQSRRNIAAHYRIPQKVVGPRLQISRAKGNRLTAFIYARVSPVPLIRLSARQTKTGVSARSGIRVQGGFIAEMNSTHVGVFVRKGGRRGRIRGQAPRRVESGKNVGKTYLPELPIQEQYLQLPQGAEITRRAVASIATTENFRRELLSQLRYRINRRFGYLIVK
jgi:hypothetical protein